MEINFQAKVAVPQGLDPRRVDSYLGKILLGDIFYSSNITSAHGKLFYGLCFLVLVDLEEDDNIVESILTTVQYELHQDREEAVPCTT
jgi:hypothetical protein